MVVARAYLVNIKRTHHHLPNVEPREGSGRIMALAPIGLPESLRTRMPISHAGMDLPQDATVSVYPAEAAVRLLGTDRVENSRFALVLASFQCRMGLPASAAWAAEGS